MHSVRVCNTHSTIVPVVVVIVKTSPSGLDITTVTEVRHD